MKRNRLVCVERAPLSVGQHNACQQIASRQTLQLETDALRKQVGRKEIAVFQHVLVGVNHFARVIYMMQCHHHYRHGFRVVLNVQECHVVECSGLIDLEIFRGAGGASVLCVA